MVSCESDALARRVLFLVGRYFFCGAVFMRKGLFLFVLAVGLVGVASAAFADEGMWTFDNFPKAQVLAKYGFAVEDIWLMHVQRSAARLANGCSASFVSGEGLVMTNHHCVQTCVSDLSTATSDLIADGFLAKTAADERQCPGVEVNQLLEIIDVTERIKAATAGLSDKAYNDALKAETSNIEKECATSDTLRCDVVSLYRGGLYHVYKYKRFQDARLVFAPEDAIASFGGDPDNFNFPRYGLDVSFLRVYEDGKPATIEHFFSWAKASVAADDLTFMIGNPGRTDRLLTLAELTFHRDVLLPERLIKLAEYRGFITEFQKRGPEQARISGDSLDFAENAFKALRGRHQTLTDAAFFEQKRQEEADLKAKIAADPAKQAKYGPAFDAITKAIETQKALRIPIAYISGGAGFDSQLFDYARTLVRAANELPKPNTERLPEFADARLPALKAKLLKDAPVYEELEIAELTFSLTKLREDLGTDHPFVKTVLGTQSPAQLAQSLITGSILKSPDERKKLLEGGLASISASTDPLILLAKRIDAEALAVRKQYEDDIESVIKKNSELIAQARFEMYGTNTYPDATFSMRITYGAVKGFVHNGAPVAPFTEIAGVFARHTGAEPFNLPKSWLDAQPKLDPKTPFNFTTNNDIIGGNSGSPVINKDAEIIGVVFDGNIYSLGGAYGFDETNNRAISVSAPLIIHALKVVYGAENLVKELAP